MRLHAVREDDAADDDGDGGGEVAGEAKSSGRGGDVSGLDLGLQGYEWRLKVWAHADTSDDLEDDKAGPGGVGGEVDVEAEAEDEEEHAEPDWFEVAARLADEDAGDDGDDGEGDDEGEEVDAREEGSGAQNGLEVEGEEVGAGHEDEAVAEAGGEHGEVGTRGEDV